MSENSSICFEVKQIPGHGRGLVATRDIEQGELIHEQRPYAATVDFMHISEVSAVAFDVQFGVWIIQQLLVSNYKGALHVNSYTIVRPIVKSKIGKQCIKWNV